MYIMRIYYFTLTKCANSILTRLGNLISQLHDLANGSHTPMAQCEFRNVPCNQVYENEMENLQQLIRLLTKFSQCFVVLHWMVYVY